MLRNFIISFFLFILFSVSAIAQGDSLKKEKYSTSEEFGLIGGCSLTGPGDHNLTGPSYNLFSESSLGITAGIHYQINYSTYFSLVVELLNETKKSTRLGINGYYYAQSWGHLVQYPIYQTEHLTANFFSLPILFRGYIGKNRYIYMESGTNFLLMYSCTSSFGGQAKDVGRGGSALLATIGLGGRIPIYRGLELSISARASSDAIEYVTPERIDLSGMNFLAGISYHFK